MCTSLIGGPRKLLGFGENAYRLGFVLSRRSPWVLLFALVLLVFQEAIAFAHPYTLPPGREKEVLALFAPYTLGGFVVPPQKLWTVSIEQTHITLGVRGPDGRETRVLLVHPEDPAADASAPHSLSFATVREPSGDIAGEAALEVLLAALARNDHGSFWAEPKRRANSDPVPRRLSALSSGNWEPIDGLVALFAFWAIAIVLSGRLLAKQARWMWITLFSIVTFGILVRLWLSPVSFLGAWPWSRLWPNARAVAEGPVLGFIARSIGHGFFLTDIISWTNFGYAALMPLVLFVHASYILRDKRAGLFAALVIAVLPQHVRFSRAEDAFVPSLVLTSLSFALLHAWLRDESRFVRVLCIVLLPFPLYTGYLLRPLNMLFLPVYAGAILFLHPEAASFRRRAVCLFLVACIWLAALPAFVSGNEMALRSALRDPSWILGVFRVVITPRLLVLSDPQVTPPVLWVLFGAGVILAYRAGEKRLVFFLLGWLVLFLCAHAFVVEPSMMPRYHLHLVVPFILLASTAVARSWNESRVGHYVALGSLLVSPLLYSGWIRDLRYVEMAEHAFVLQARDLIPDRCTVIEYAGRDAEARDLRFKRIGALGGVVRSNRFEVIPAFAEGTSGRASGKTIEDIMADPPACLYIYEGLPCYSDKEEGERFAAECFALSRDFKTEMVAERGAALLVYDRNNIPKGGVVESGLRFSLLRVVGRRP